MACNWAGKTRGAYLPAMAKILAWLGGKFVVFGDEAEVLADELGTLEDVLGNEVEFLEDVVEVLENELEVFGDGNKTLGWRGSLGMNDSVEWSVVEIIYEVVLNKDEFKNSEWMVEGLGETFLESQFKDTIMWGFQLTEGIHQA